MWIRIDSVENITMSRIIHLNRVTLTLNRPSSQAPDRTATGSLTLFGHEPTQATVVVLERSRRWRIGRTATVAVLTLILAPLVALIPPHAPWAVAALGIGATMTRRRWLERHTVQSMSGDCPRCATSLSIERPTRLRHPHALSCPTCHHEPLLKVTFKEHGLG